MPNILIVYSTNYGNTKKMAEAVAAGARTVKEATVTLKTAQEATLDDTKAADALVLGSPVHMGSPSWEIKQYIDTVCAKLWMENTLTGRVGAVFATGSGYGNGGGGAELTLLGLMNNLVELGLLIVPLPKNTPGYAKAGLQWGPYGRSAGENMEQTGLSDAHLQAATHHGTHIARVTSLLHGKSWLTP